MAIQSIQEVIKLHWVGGGHPIHTMTLHDLGGYEANSVRAVLTGVGIYDIQCIPDGPPGNYKVLVERAEADKLENLIAQRSRR